LKHVDDLSTTGEQGGCFFTSQKALQLVDVPHMTCNELSGWYGWCVGDV